MIEAKNNNLARVADTLAPRDAVDQGNFLARKFFYSEPRCEPPSLNT